METVLALARPTGAAAVVGTGTHWFAIGLLTGILAAVLVPRWLTVLIVIFDLVALGWMSGILNYVDAANGRWVLVAAPFLIIGLYFGVTRGLKHLSDSEFRTRHGNIRKLGRYL